MKEAIKIIKKLQDKGYHALLVGGCNRDKLMSNEPKDYDISTNCLPEEIKKIFKNTKPIGEAYGVMLVNNNYEVSTMRSDIHNPNNFAVELLESSKYTLEELLEKDAQRRDLTINGIYYDPISDKYYDPVGGINDIKYSTLRFVGHMKDRVQEDPVRLLRYVRFMVKYPHLDPVWSDYDALISYRELLKRVSKERIFEETTKILMNFYSWDIDHFKVFLELFKDIIPELAEFKNIKQPSIHHPEVSLLKHTFYSLKNLRVKTPVTVWTTFLHDLGKVKDTKIEEDGKISSHGHDETGAVMTEEILRDLKCSNKFIEEVVYIVRQHMRIKWASTMRKAKVIKLIKNPFYENLKEVSCADSMGAKGNIEWYKWITDFEKSDRCPKGDIIEPLVKGSDLIDLDYTPGPEFKTLLKKALDLQLENPDMKKDQILLDITKEVCYNTEKGEII